MPSEWLSGIKVIDELPINGKRVLMRLDLNVPVKDGKVTDDTRIREALPTIQYAMSKGAKLVLMSHFGRPEGHDEKYSLAPIAEHLSELLNTDVLLPDDCVGDGVQMIVKNLRVSQVVLLENVRFHTQEEANDAEFARELAAHGDIYINDAFGTAHREHASTYGVPQVMPIRGCGFLVKKELEFLGRLLTNPEHPYIVILGGSKVSDKIKTIENLYLMADTVLIGGAMGNTFRVAQGHTLPPNAKQPKADEIQHAKALIEKARKHEVNLVLPIDDVDSFDIGPKTIELFVNEISKAKTIFWNGPVGMFEKPEYAKGTLAVAHAMATSRGLKVVGGGDTVAAINLAGVATQMDHISTGGGASLEFLEGKGLPGINILKTWSKTRVEPQVE
jgi:phosphoglycerate kinase